MECAPERIGRYELVTEIARGPFGRFNAAFVASGPEEGRIVTVREIAIPATDYANHERVRRAGVYASSIRHPDLVAVLDVISTPNAVAVISEYVDSSSLKALLRRTSIARAPLAPGVVLTLAMSIVRALRDGVAEWTKAVSRNDDASLVHGGLLPDSVFIATFGETMLADLGIAGAVSRTLALSRDANAVAYRAPEQLEGKPIDERADVYGVGVLLWEMLANRPLFGPRDRFVLDVGGVARDVSRDVCARRVPRLDSIPRPGKKLSPILVEMVQQLLAGDRDARFPSLDGLLEALGTVAVELASPEQVAVAVDHMMRSELEARRSKLESVVGFDRTSLPPQSARSTARPPPPTAGQGIVPADPDSADFSPVEVTTARRKSSERRLPPPIPTRTKPPVPAKRPPPRESKPPRSIISTPPPPLAVVAPLPPVILEAKLPVFEPPLLDPAEPAQAPVEPVMLGISPAPSARSRQLGLLIGVAIAVTVGIVAIALIRWRTPSPDTATRPAEPVMSAPLEAKSSNPEVASPRETTSEPPLPPATSAPPRENDPRTPTPTGGKKPYRPRGI